MDEPFRRMQRICKIGQDTVVVWREAERHAEQLFGLRSTKEIIRFIGDGGLCEPQLINQKPWDNNPRPQDGKVTVYAYSCSTGDHAAYVAFFEFEGRLHIKSFKLDDTKLSPTIRSKGK